MARRYQKAITVALLLLNISGARVVAVTDSCEHCRSFFVPASSFRAIAKVVTHQQWKRHAPHSLGARANRYSSQDLQTVRRERPVLPLAILPPVNIALGTELSRNRLVYAWRLPRDRSPVLSPQLN